MIKWLKLANPSWWTYQLKYRNFPLFWWRCLTTKPFPPDISSVDDLLTFGERRRTQAFNQEWFRSYILWQLYQHFRCTSFVETGTLYGNTAAFARRVFNSPVFSSEINSTFHLVSRANLLWLNRVKLFRSDSVDFLEKVYRESAIGDNPMFYLDAHWYGYLPLPDELTFIADRCQRGIIIIDDFFIPSEPGFLHDEYDGVRIDLDLIDTYLRPKRKDVSVYLPRYKPGQDPGGKGIGYAVILLGQDEQLLKDAFPFDLLAKVAD